jgi:hypothetical protein
MEQTNWRSLGQKIGKGLINAVTGKVGIRPAYRIPKFRP